MFDGLPELPPVMKQLVAGVAGLFPVAAFARFLWHHRLVQMGHHRFWSRDLVWELPTAALIDAITPISALSTASQLGTSYLIAMPRTVVQVKLKML